MSEPTNTPTNEPTNTPGSPTPTKPSYTLLWISLAALGASLLVLRAATASPADPAAAEAARSLWTTIGVWTAALLTLGIFSFLYRDNPFYKVCESVLIGVSAAYWMVNGFWTSLVPQLFANLMPGTIREHALPSLPVSATPNLDFWLALVPLALGVMLLMRISNLAFAEVVQNGLGFMVLLLIGLDIMVVALAFILFPFLWKD